MPNEYHTPTTSKPCPGCGREGKRPAAGVCRHCQADLALAKATKAAQAADTGTELYGGPSTHNDGYSASGLYPYTEGTRLISSRYSRDQSYPPNVLGAAMSTLVKQVVARDENYGSTVNSNHQCLFAHHVNDAEWYKRQPVPYQAKPATAEALRALDLAIRASLVHAFNEGLAQGSSLLGQLAQQGADPFNDAVIGAAKKVREQR